jgi:hypothetical protein
MDTSQPKILEVRQTKVEKRNFQGTLAEIGNWSFDGSSTRQSWFI